MPDQTIPAEIVRQFCALMENRDAEAVRSFFAEDAVYQNVGMPASVGQRLIAENLAAQFAAYPDSYEYELVNLAANGDVVMTERVDYIRTPAGDRVGIPVMGTFVVRDGKIVRWTDYWDTALPAKFASGQDVSALLPAEARS
jgi:limonene-1,2-epoxide hydrolase